MTETYLVLWLLDETAYFTDVTELGVFLSLMLELACERTTKVQ